MKQLYIITLGYALWTWFWLRISFRPWKNAIKNRWPLTGDCILAPLAAMSLVAAGYGGAHMFIWKIPNIGSYGDLLVLGELFDRVVSWLIPALTILLQGLKSSQISPQAPIIRYHQTHLPLEFQPHANGVGPRNRLTQFPGSTIPEHPRRRHR